MHLTTILAFAFIFWRAELGPSFRLLPSDDIWPTLLVVVLPPFCWGGLAWWCARRVKRNLMSHPERRDSALRFHHRSGFFLRTSSLLTHALLVMVTPWPDWLRLGEHLSWLQIVGDWIVLMPLLAGWFLFWMAGFTVESAARYESVRRTSSTAGLGKYLDFQLRHQFLTVAVPMSIILWAANVIREHRTEIEEWAPWIGGPDFLLGSVALTVFLAAPVLLRWVWRTHPLEAGALRTRLETMCRRIGLRVRQILVWNSDGMMVNAAVMGVLPPIRFVLLSDSLLATLTSEQIEAVFGHEAGHVRHRHIQYLLAFAFLGWLLVAGLMELLARSWEGGAGGPVLTTSVISCVGIAATVLFWGVGFGWLSRRFERQADAFGAWCVTPMAERCSLPCGLHRDGAAAPSAHSLCATAATLFASALGRVAQLNGIPLEERSWRHSSITSRMHFLSALASDPRRAERFDRTLRRCKRGIIALTACGSLAALAYGVWVI